MEPRFNEVSRDWGNWFVKSRVRYAENLDLTNLRKNNQNVRYIEIWSIIKNKIKIFSNCPIFCLSLKFVFFSFSFSFHQEKERGNSLSFVPDLSMS